MLVKINRDLYSRILKVKFNDIIIYWYDSVWYDLVWCWYIYNVIINELGCFKLMG